MANRQYRLHPMTRLFLGVLTLTLVVWVLRGIALLAFLPGIVLWVLILLSFGLGIMSSLQRIR
jgi:hypothetical protein